MIAPFVVSCVWCLTMLVAVALAARPGLRMGDAMAMAAAFALTLLVSRFVGLQLGWIGVLAGLVAGWRLLHGRSRRVDCSAAGVCAGLAAALYVTSAVSLGLSAGISAGGLIAAVGLAQFGREARGHELALAAAAVLTPLVAAGPEVMAGWRSAGLLNHAEQAARGQAIPIWALIFVGAALAAGAAKGLWIRK